MATGGVAEPMDTDVPPAVTGDAPMPNDVTNTECSVCDAAKSAPIRVLLFRDLETLLQNVGKEDEEAKKKKDEKTEDTLKLFCAALNCQGTTAVLFHVADMRCVNSYDNQWNERLMELVPDSSCYHDVFERLDLDLHHFRVRVRPRRDPEHGVPSTRRFHSSVSRDKGLHSHPPPHVMLRLFRSALDNEEGGEVSQRHLPDDRGFVLNTEVEVTGTAENGERSIVPFQESTYLQAKSIKEANLPLDEIVDLMWGNSELGKYISAFSKVPGGGVIYFGIREKYEKSSPDKQKALRLVRFETEGVHVHPSEHATLAKELNTRIEEELLWVTAAGNGNVETGGKIEFLEAKGKSTDDKITDAKSTDDKKRWVIKITVNPFQGICFFQKEGPESYELDENNEPVKVTWDKWAENSICKDLKPARVSFRD